MYRYLFGPVPSRRLGYSLGIDLVPGKTCSYDCVFCQVGRTTRLATERKEYVPVSGVVEEFSTWLKSDGKADYVTLAGSGEPTLNSGFGRVIKAVHEKSRIKAAVLSNGSLFYLPEVRDAAAQADLVKVSLSAWDQQSFEKINRPCSGLIFEKVLDGLRSFGAVFRNELWVEVFVVKGVNDDHDSMRQIAALCEGIKPGRIHLNTVVRPPAESSARPVSGVELERIARLFTPCAEVIPAFDLAGVSNVGDSEDRIVSLLSRHPCTAKDVSVLFGGDEDNALLKLAGMVERGVIRVEKHGGDSYYTAVGGKAR